MDFFRLNESQTKKAENEKRMHLSFNDEEFRVILVSSSDLETDKLILLKVKCLFEQQLSRMSKEYILRQVFDKKHINMVLMDKKGNVVSGICYRQFFGRSFAEIVFLAVDYDFQVKGVGSFIMDLFKENIKMEMIEFEKACSGRPAHKNKTILNLNYFPEKLESPCGKPLYIMVYADDFAIGYFKKQGFSKEIKFDRWIGVIKDYDGGVAFGCRVFWEINYLRKRDFIKKIEDKIIGDMERINRYHVTHAVTDYSDINEIRDIPGVDKNVEYECASDCVDGLMDRFMLYLISDLRSNTFAWPFLSPVNSAEVPDYYKHISKPMDISTMLKKLEEGTYKTIEPLINDVKLMLNNCFEYNGKDTQYYKCAQASLKYFAEKLEFYRYIVDKFLV